MDPHLTGDFESLLIAHQQQLLFFIKSHLPNHHEAEDVLQRTNLILWRKRERFEQGSNFRAWSFTVARLEALNQLKQQRREQRIFTDHPESEPSTEGAPTREAPDADVLWALKNCLHRLPAHDQELVRMRYDTDRTLGEYAKHLNRSPGTLKARLFKIRETLRKGIEEHLGGAEPPVSAR